MQIVIASEEKRAAIKELLQSNNLPTEDLPVCLNHFFIALEAETVIGIIGMERYDDVALLRSLVVHSNHRDKRIAETLVEMLEKLSISAGIRTMYLLTETAENYFYKKGYTTILRDEVPMNVLQSSEFRYVCPASAIVMRKQFVTLPA